VIAPEYDVVVIVELSEHVLAGLIPTCNLPMVIPYFVSVTITSSIKLIFGNPYISVVTLRCFGIVRGLVRYLQTPSTAYLEYKDILHPIHRSLCLILYHLITDCHRQFPFITVINVVL